MKLPSTPGRLRVRGVTAGSRAVLLVSLLLGACGNDPERAKDLRVECTRPITDDLMMLHCDDRGGYYVVRSFALIDDDGLLDGKVIRIGWNDRYLWAERKATFAADHDGWMIVDCNQHLVLGPYSDSGFAERARTISGGPLVESSTAEEAWGRLGKGVAP